VVILWLVLDFHLSYRLVRIFVVMFWIVRDFHLSLWTCSSLCGNIFCYQGLSFGFMNLQ